MDLCILSVCLSIHLSLSIYFVYLSICLPIYLYIYLSAYLSLCLFLSEYPSLRHCLYSRVSFIVWFLPSSNNCRALHLAGHHETHSRRCVTGPASSRLFDLSFQQLFSFTNKKLSKHGRRSGSVAFLIHKTVMSLVIHIECEHDKLIWFKLAKDAVGSDRDLLIISV